MNVRGINEIAKREVVVDLFRERKFELLTLTETVERDWRGVMVWVNGIIDCVWEIERARVPRENDSGRRDSSGFESRSKNNSFMLSSH